MSSATLLTLPNVLTLLRILAVPFFAIAFWYGHMWEAFILFIGAGVTDLLDGYLARRFDQGSKLGAILDPAADKLLMTVAFLLLAFTPGLRVARVPAWVAILSVSRDALISLVAVMSAGDFDLRRFRPSLLGKLTTALELVAISLGLLVNLIPPQPWMPWVFPHVYYLVAAMVLASGLHYFFRSANLAQESR